MFAPDASRSGLWLPQARLLRPRCPPPPRLAPRMRPRKFRRMPSQSSSTFALVTCISRKTATPCSVERCSRKLPRFSLRCRPTPAFAASASRWTTSSTSSSSSLLCPVHALTHRQCERRLLDPRPYTMLMTRYVLSGTTVQFTLMSHAVERMMSIAHLLVVFLCLRNGPTWLLCAACLLFFVPLCASVQNISEYFQTLHQGMLRTR